MKPFKSGFSKCETSSAVLAGPRLNAAFEQLGHFQQIPASLGQRIDDLTDPMRTLIRFDDEVGEQDKDQEQNRHVHISNPVAIVRQCAPYTAMR